MTVIRSCCPTCGRDKNAEVIAEHEELVENNDFCRSIDGDVYRILKCAGCSRIYFQNDKASYWGDEPDPDSFTELKDLIAWSKEADLEFDCACEETISNLC